MKQAGAIVFVVTLFAILAASSFWTGRESVRAVRRWRAGLRQPLISPDRGVAASLPPHWPVNAERWPQPFADGERQLARGICAIYAHEAWRKHGRIRAASELALVAGGAWLGSTLPNTVQMLFAGERTLLLAFFPSVFLDLHWWNVVLPGAVVALGLGLQSQADGIELVRAAYSAAAQVPATPPGIAPELSEEPSSARPRLGLLDRVLGRVWSTRR